LVYRWSGLGQFSGISLRTGKIIENKGKISVIYELSEGGERRLGWLDYYEKHDRNARLTCRHFGISPRTFYKAKNRHGQEGYKGLNNRSRRPKHFRESKIPLTIISRIIAIRTDHPSWSKYKIGACLRREGFKISDSSVGRVLKKKNKIDHNVSKKKKRVYKRSLRRLRIDDNIFFLRRPGDLVQIDIKHYRYLWGYTVYQFTAVDCVSKLRVLRLYSTRTSSNGKLFLRELIRFFPFRIKRIQSDNDSAFLGVFRKACAKARIIHVFSYPRSPEQNAFVESSHSTDEREFYSVKEMPDNLEAMKTLLADWERCYNYERPHQSLNQMTPWDYYNTICSKN